MYRFRTRPCTKKRCRNPPKCFDAHSGVMIRRVPGLGAHRLYNYIPKPCPQWEKMKKCHLGDSCPRSHGWLEIIFHPLLYKTKLCKSSYKNGVCREYGVFCAKAHKPTEIRDLEKIYGENWKRHYDHSLRELDVSSSGISKTQKYLRRHHCIYSSTRRSGRKFKNHKGPLRPNSYCSEQTQGRKSAEATPKLTSSAGDVDQHDSPLPFISPSIFGSWSSICEHMADLTLDGRDTSYDQL